MLTNLNWIAEGKEFPPKQERERIERYHENEKLFNGDHIGVFGKSFRAIEDVLRKKHHDPMVVFNYPQLLTKKTADFVCGEPAEITVSKKRSDELNTALDSINFDTLIYEAVMDVSRFGNAPIKILNDRVSIVAPDCWFPIVDSTDLKRITHHVIAFPTEPDDDGNYTKIYVEIHEPGYVETRAYEAAGFDAGAQLQFGRLLEIQERYETGLRDFGVKILSNVSHSKSIYGLDDYNIIKSITKGIIWRVHCIDGVLNKHSDPSISIPESAMAYDEKWGHYVDLGKAFVRNSKDDVPVEYITWDGNLDAAFKDLEFMVNQLYILSEMGAAFMEGGGQGAANSGTALKLRMTSPRIKSGRIAGVNTQTVKQLIAIIAQIRGVKGVEVKNIGLSWNDGIPNDEKEMTETYIQATGGKAIKSQRAAIKEYNDFDDEDAAAMQEEIWAEQAAFSPVAFQAPHRESGVNVNDAGREIDTEVQTGAAGDS